MTIPIFLLTAIILVLLTVYFTLKRKIKCHNCFSRDVIKTGKKIYKEDPPIAVFGSPDSHHELEYKCNNCGNIFWEKQKAIIFN